MKKKLFTHNIDKLKQTTLQLQEAQQQLIQSEKMASLGTIAAGVAHEINNPLSFLLSNLESLEVYMRTFRKLIDGYESGYESLIKNNTQIRMSLKPFEQIQEYRNKNDVQYMLTDYENLLRESLEGVYRIREIVQSLQTFSRTSDNEFKFVDLNDCIKTALRIVSNELKYKCMVNKNFGKLPKIQCNPSHLLQVFMNILLNAAQAITEKGIITVTTESKKNAVWISIQDTGSGISEENKQKLFTPFFTTKPTGQGTGLGLSVSYGIIKELKGTIEVESQLGRGTTFTIIIPYEASEVKE